MTPKFVTFTSGEIYAGYSVHYFGGKIVRQNYDFTTLFLSNVTTKDLKSDNRYLRFSDSKQKYGVTLRKSFMTYSPNRVLDCSEWFEGTLLKFLAEEAGDNWSVDIEMDLTDQPVDDRLNFNFTFSDIETATLFRLRF